MAKEREDFTSEKVAEIVGGKTGSEGKERPEVDRHENY
jgi:hypothetical protein